MKNVIKKSLNTANYKGGVFEHSSILATPLLTGGFFFSDMINILPPSPEYFKIVY